MAWLTAHHQIISLFINGSMLVVWLFYAHLLLNNYRRQRRPKVLINQSLRKGIDSRCLICNMSEEAIYISLMVAELKTSEGTWECEITDFVPNDDPPGGSILNQTTQGPLGAGDFRDLESFRTMINRVLGSRGVAQLYGDQEAAVELHQLSIHVVGVYVSEDAPVGASRHFGLVLEDDGYRLQPTAIDTERLSSPSQRRRIKKWMQRYL